jgi:hypothetical protein
MKRNIKIKNEVNLLKNIILNSNYFIIYFFFFF